MRGFLSGYYSGALEPRDRFLWIIIETQRGLLTVICIILAWCFPCDLMLIDSHDGRPIDAQRLLLRPYLIFK